MSGIEFPIRNDVLLLIKNLLIINRVFYVTKGLSFTLTYESSFKKNYYFDEEKEQAHTEVKTTTKIYGHEEEGNNIFDL